MKLKKWWIAKLLKWSHILDIEKALRDKYHEGEEANEKKHAEGRQARFIPVSMQICPNCMKQAYPQKQEPPQKTTDSLHLPPGTLARGWHEMEQSGVHPTISQALKRIRITPVRTNTAPIDPKKDFPAFLNDKEDTLQVPAVDMQAFHQERHAS